MLAFRCPLLAILLIALAAHRSLAIKCFNMEDAQAKDCPTTGNIVKDVQGGLASAWKWAKDLAQGAADTAFLDNIGERLKKETGIDITDRKKNNDWVQKVLGNTGLDFDISNNCWVSYSKSTGATTDRGCGAAGEVGVTGAKLLKYLQGNPVGILAGGSICFTAPGDASTEMCMCKDNGCNKDKAAARSALGIGENARTTTCGGKDCPVSNLATTIDGWTGFNTACYKKMDGQELCFTTNGIYDEEVVAQAKVFSQMSPEDLPAAQARSSIKFSNVDGGAESLVMPVLLIVSCLILARAA